MVHPERPLGGKTRRTALSGPVSSLSISFSRRPSVRDVTIGAEACEELGSRGRKRAGEEVPARRGRASFIRSALRFHRQNRQRPAFGHYSCPTKPRPVGQPNATLRARPQPFFEAPHPSPRVANPRCARSPGLCRNPQSFSFSLHTSRTACAPPFPGTELAPLRRPTPQTTLARWPARSNVLPPIGPHRTAFYRAKGKDEARSSGGRPQPPTGVLTSSQLAATLSNRST